MFPICHQNQGFCSYKIVLIKKRVSHDVDVDDAAVFVDISRNAIKKNHDVNDDRGQWRHRTHRQDTGSGGQLVNARLLSRDTSFGAVGHVRLYDSINRIVAGSRATRHGAVHIIKFIE